MEQEIEKLWHGKGQQQQTGNGDSLLDCSSRSCYQVSISQRFRAIRRSSL